jgi:hypothetical protein
LQKAGKKGRGKMRKVTLQLFRVRVYNRSDGAMTHSFRVASENNDSAETKVENYFLNDSATKMFIARPAGIQEFWQ